MTSVSFEVDDNNKNYQQPHQDVTMIPYAEAVSDHSASSYFSLSEDVDSLWDDVSAMRRDLSVITNDLEDYKDQSDDTMNFIIRKQQSESGRLDESVATLTTEMSNLKVQMAILREKTIKNELMLDFLMQRAGSEAREQFEAAVASKAVGTSQPMSDLTQQLDSIIEGADQ